MSDEKKDLKELLQNSKVQKIEVKGELERSFIAYAMAVNVSRAIPDVRDGLKPVHRRILYDMGEQGLFHTHKFVKSATIVGDVLGHYHPHGDSSVYDALVRLAQDFSINHPLVDGHGNFGSIDGDGAAAYRYTEARLTKIAGLLLEDIDKNTVDMYPNYDDTRMQPRVLPAKFPNLLVNGADGIAVGMATNIPPHNLAEVCTGVQELLRNPELSDDELIEIIKAPDFPTGGIIMGRKGIIEAYKTGRGNIVVRGKAEIEETASGKQRIIISEIPYQVNKAKFIVQMADLVKNKRIEGISDIKEESDREGIRVVVDIKKDHNANVVLNQLYKMSMLQSSGGIIMLALVDGAPKICSLREILDCYIAHQKDVVVRKTRFDLKKAEDRMHIVSGLVTAVTNIDDVVKIIKESDDRSDAQNKLIAKFGLDEIQTNAILDMRLSKLTGLEVNNLKEELEELERTIADLNDILAKPERVVKIIDDQMEDVKTRFGTPRRTEISFAPGDINIGDLIKKEDVVISMTEGGYIKRMSLTEYRAQHRGGVGVTGHKTKEEDVVDQVFITHSHNDVLFFTSKGKVHTMKAYEIPEANKTSKGRAMVNLLPLDAEEKVSTILPLTEDTTGNLVLATKKGLIKKTKLLEFASIRKNGKIAITLEEGDELLAARTSDGDDEIFVASSAGKCSRFKESGLRNTGRTSMGVKAIDLESDEEIISVCILNKEMQLASITENGYGKRTNSDEFRLTARGTKGVRAGVFNEKTGKLVALIPVEEDKDLLVMADNGVVIRTPVSSIPLISRSTQGVKVMRLKGDAKIVSAAVGEHEEDNEETMTAEDIVIANIEASEENNENSEE
ncbi:MAG: DNA gyrase subunit A [Clostridia bacterium]|nr:DNA gyrase subunit A [Clostridia bacterium]